MKIREKCHENWTSCSRVVENNVNLRILARGSICVGASGDYFQILLA